MKRLVFLVLISLSNFLTFADTTEVIKDSSTLVATDSVVEKEVAESEVINAADVTSAEGIDLPIEDVTIHQIIKDKFIEGGVLFMGIVLICLILGLAIAIERVITINLAYINVKKFMTEVEDSLDNGGVEKAKDLCAKTQGPIASIFMQGFSRLKEGLEAVEKSIIAYGSVEMGKLEKGLTWVSLFISLAPMLGFMGTVIGMIDAFDTIEQAEDIKIDEVASGIKVALLTTVAGLIVAVILQIFYNYLVSKIDALVNQMEEASVFLVDMLIERDLISNK